jgi:hypothetical protein
MVGRRRNTILHDDARVIVVLAVVSALVAAFSGSAPTGHAAIDALLVMAFAAFTTWAGASAPWWALSAGAVIVAGGAIAGPMLVMAPAVLALGVSLWIGDRRANQPIVRSAIAAVIVQGALRLDWNPVFLWSALLAAAATGVIIVSGVVRRRRYVRRRVYVGAGIVGGLLLIGVAGLGVAAFGARESASAGYIGMLDGLEFVQQGKTLEAAQALRTAAEDLDDASQTIGGPLTQLARFVPGVAQNRSAATDVLAGAADSAASAASTLDVVVLDQLTIQNGVIDVRALAVLASPLDALLGAIDELDESLRGADTPWLVSPFKARLDDAIDRANQVVPQARATAAAARIAPAMLGADGERRYFVAFVNNAEARGQSGLMGNWSEITVDNGRLEVTANGRTAELQEDALRQLELVASDEYLARYGAYGASISGGVDVKFWSNVTIPPDMPSVGNAMAQMYETATGRSVDGVLVIDPAGIAGLMGVTGSIRLDELDLTLNSSNVEEFLVIGQYEFAENEREDLLAAVTEQTIKNVVDGTLPPPQQLAPALAPAVLNGHISAWAVRPDEQELLELVGMDASLPVITEPGTDGFAVSSNNGSGNKIESFLKRSISYQARVDEGSGDVTSTLKVEITNSAPTSGYPDYVIGNLIDEPTGTNRMVVDIHTMLEVVAARVDGAETGVVTLPELGYNAWRSQVTIPAGETVVIELDLAGNVGSGDYRLVYRPQPLPNADRVKVEAVTTGRSGIFIHEGVVKRRSVFSADRVEAWRPSE